MCRCASTLFQPGCSKCFDLLLLQSEHLPLFNALFALNLQLSQVTSATCCLYAPSLSEAGFLLQSAAICSAYIWYALLGRLGTLAIQQMGKKKTNPPNGDQWGINIGAYVKCDNRHEIRVACHSKIWHFPLFFSYYKISTYGERGQLMFFLVLPWFHTLSSELLIDSCYWSKAASKGNHICNLHGATQFIRALGSTVIVPASQFCRVISSGDRASLFLHAEERCFQLEYVKNIKVKKK